MLSISSVFPILRCHSLSLPLTILADRYDAIRINLLQHRVLASSLCTLDTLNTISPRVLLIWRQWESMIQTKSHTISTYFEMSLSANSLRLLEMGWRVALVNRYEKQIPVMICGSSIPFFGIIVLMTFDILLLAGACPNSPMEKFGKYFRVHYRP